MNVLIDADGCPVVDIAIRLCGTYGLPCLLLCDTAHEFHREGAQTLVVGKGADSVDYALVNRVRAGDIVVTQDYGLASMCLARGAQVLHQDGWAYTPDNIDALLLLRHNSRKLRASGSRVKGPKKRTQAQNAAFEAALRQMLHTSVQG
ncbi:MAG: YaiI/YqxD family protein [Eubacteriales bacterium]|nr:YaiI/YqxD family protein [Eubacteriales bacterium]